MTIGIRMMLRGRVGLHFACAEMGLAVVNHSVFAPVVIVGIVKTLLTHPLLKPTLI